MEAKGKVLWYAVNSSGQGVVFCSRPERDGHRRIWVGEISGLYSALVMQMESEELLVLPPMTWKDEPVMLEVTIGLC